jgi:hypothetical protein
MYFHAKQSLFIPKFKKQKLYTDEVIIYNSIAFAFQLFYDISMVWTFKIFW